MNAYFKDFCIIHSRHFSKNLDIFTKLQAKTYFFLVEFLAKDVPWLREIALENGRDAAFSLDFLEESYKIIAYKCIPCKNLVNLVCIPRQDLVKNFQGIN